jgi:hypothetical protein
MWIPHVNKRRDLFGVADIIAFKPGESVLLVQSTSLPHVGDRLKRCRSRPALALWLRAGGKFEVHGWARRQGKWVVKRVNVSADDLRCEVLQAPSSRRRRKGTNQSELFPVAV